MVPVVIATKPINGDPSCTVIFGNVFLWEAKLLEEHLFDVPQGLDIKLMPIAKTSSKVLLMLINKQLFLRRSIQSNLILTDYSVIDYQYFEWRVIQQYNPHEHIIGKTLRVTQCSIPIG
ncbi:hypothetical protein M23134_00842 [Microscilla marina ATCC 23134]|uniref:Uncharacterized protein n=2 Tax=Microscilla marina TaxID=1027 RepID=A1ZUK2_MICM2|nr:hypothetical protein M23134_00842 [Microscilla marina ATCC 23134]